MAGAAVAGAAETGGGGRACGEERKKKRKNGELEGRKGGWGRGYLRKQEYRDEKGTFAPEMSSVTSGKEG